MGEKVRRLDREPVEVSHSAFYPNLERSLIEGMIAGALRDAINQHGPLTTRDIGSATKRIIALLKTPDGRVGCPYCRERLRVNVGLLSENTELRRARLSEKDERDGE